jgi:hypothetical protein
LIALKRKRIKLKEKHRKLKSTARGKEKKGMM